MSEVSKNFLGNRIKFIVIVSPTPNHASLHILHLKYEILKESSVLFYSKFD